MAFSETSQGALEHAGGRSGVSEKTTARPLAYQAG